MIPYLVQPEWQVAGMTVRFFGVMVIAALAFGFTVVAWRAKQVSLPVFQAMEGTLWVVLASLICSHVVAIIAYRPQDFMQNPGLILDITGDMSNLGGMLGGIGAILVCGRLYRWTSDELMHFFDAVTWGFVFGHFFGRLGCAVAHDHPGILSSSILAVRFPEGPRLDLGLIEWLWINLCIGAFLYLSRRARQPGFYVSLFLMAHGLMRFLLDFLRVGDTRIGGLTPAQYACFALVLISLLMTRRYRLFDHPACPGQDRKRP